MIKFEKDFEDSFYKEEVKTYDPVIQNVNGSRIIVFVERTKDLNEGLSYEDFSILSLLDADALDLLSPVSPVSRDTLSVADVADSVANYLGNTLDNVNVNVEPSNKTEE